MFHNNFNNPERKRERERERERLTYITPGVHGDGTDTQNNESSDHGC